MLYVLCASCFVLYVSPGVEGNGQGGRRNEQGEGKWAGGNLAIASGGL